MIRVIPTMLLSLFFLAASAAAALGVTTVSRAGNTFTVTGGDEVNYVEIKPGGGDSGPVRFRDPGGLNFGAGCVDVGDFTAECGLAGPGLVANVTLGGGNDTFRPEYTLTTFPALVVDLGPGDDTTWGSANNDTISGGDGADTVIAMGGQDTIDGGAGNDRLTGSSGDDTITGGPGVDSLFGDGEFSGFSYGNDTLKAQDGEIDSLSCSFGADTAVADANDVFDVLGDCESRTIGSGATPPGPPAASALNIGLSAPTAPKLAALLSGKPVRMRITISAPCDLEMGLVVPKAEARRLKLGAKSIIIAAGAGSIDAAGTYPVTLRIAKKFRAKLRRQARVRVAVVAVCEAADKTTDTAARNLILKR